MKYNIEPIEISFNGIVETTAVKLEIEITYKVGDVSVLFKYIYYNSSGLVVKEREQPIPSDLLGQYSDAGALQLAASNEGITFI